MPTEIINVRIDGNDKLQAEAVLSQLGLKPSEVIRMLYRQIIMRQGLPFDVAVAVPVTNAKKQMKFKAQAERSLKRHRTTYEELFDK